MSNRISLDELESYLWNSAVLLRTNIDAGAYKQYIFPLLFFKRICDVYDEETAAAVEKYGEDIDDFDEEELHTFVVPQAEKILQEERIFSKKDLPYTTQLIPLAVLCTLLADGNRIHITNIKNKVKQSWAEAKRNE